MKTTSGFSKASTRLGLLVLTLAIVSAGASANAADGNEQIVVKMNGVGQYNWDGVYGPSQITASGGTVLPLNETGSVYIAKGHYREDGAIEDALGNSSSGARRSDDGHKDALLAKHPHLWWADVRPVASDVGEIEVEVAWTHRFKEHRDAPERVIAGDTRTITMKEGERHVLDFADAGPEAHSRNTVIEITVAVKEDPALENESLGYDLWYRHADADGTVTARRFQATGQQGEELDFRFTPLRFPVLGAVVDDGSGVEAILEVLGTIQGRVRTDGSIDVRLGARRWVDAEKAGAPRRGGIGGGGTKNFSAAAGETVSMVLPAPAGRNGVSVTTTAHVQGSTEPPDPDHVWVDNKEFFAGHQDELILTVTRER